MNLSRSNRPFISGLLFASGPTAVAWLVISIVVDAVNGLTVWPWSHVGKKVFEVAPSCADIDTASAIVLIGWVVFVYASTEHPGPSGILSRAIHPMGGRRAKFGATTGPSYSLPSQRRPCDALVTAVTTKYPENNAVLIVTCKFQRRKSAVPLTMSYRREFSERSHFDLPDRLKWLGPAGVISTAFRAAFYSTIEGIRT